MSLLMHPQRGTITTVAGTGTANIVCKDNLLLKLYINPATATTSYDVKLTDINSLDTFTRQDVVGELNEIDVGEPTYGNWTLTIENASADEVFNYLLVFRES